MRLKFTILLLLSAMLPVLAQTGIKGYVVDARSGRPVADANILLDTQGLFAASASDGSFQITGAQSGTDQLKIVAFGYEDFERDVDILKGRITDLGKIALTPD